MADIMIRRRKRLRSKETKAYSEELEKKLGVSVFAQDDPVDMAESTDFNVLFVNGDILGMVYNEKTFLTVRGLLKYRPQRCFVTVDMGAVPYVTNGADIMGPGIVDADEDVKEGDIVWIRDVNNLVPLAVGVALFSGTELKKKAKGKAIKNLHNVGDKLWKAGE